MSSLKFSKKWLQEEYSYYNKKYFKNKLPKCEIIFSDSGGVSTDRKFEKKYAGVTMFMEKGDPVIVLSYELKIAYMFVAATLLHEMIHISTNNPNHGPIFKKECRRLFLAGAFDELL